MAAVPVLEPGQGLVAADVDAGVEVFGDADALVIVSDLSLVVPEHRQAMVAADAVHLQLEDLAAAAPGADDRFPGIPQPAVVGVELLQLAEAGLVGQGTGDVIGERAAGPPGAAPPGGGEGGDEPAVQADLVGVAGLQRPEHDPAAVVEDALEGAISDERRLPAGADHAQRFQAVPVPVPLVGEEPLGVLRPQRTGVMTAAGGVDLQEGAQLDAGTPGLVEWPAAAGAHWGERRISARCSQSRSRSQRWDTPMRQK